MTPEERILARFTGEAGVIFTQKNGATLREDLDSLLEEYGRMRKALGDTCEALARIECEVAEEASRKRTAAKKRAAAKIVAAATLE